MVHAAISGDKDDSGFGAEDSAPGSGDPIVLRAASPLELPIPTIGANPEYWLTHEGYVPFRYRLPSGLPADEIDVFLSPAAILDVEIDRDTGPGARVALYELASEPRRPTGSPLRVIPPALRTRLTDLSTGSYAVFLEAIQDGRVGEELDAAWVELVSGEVSTVTLSPREPEATSGTILFRFEGGRSDQDLGASIVPFSLEAERLQDKGSLRPPPGLRSPGSWGPIELRRGEHLLKLELTSQVFRFTVGEGEELQLDVPVQSARDFYVAFVDAQTSAPIRVQSLFWSAPTNFQGKPDSDCAIAPFRGRGNSFDQVHAPAFPIYVMAMTDGYGMFEGRIDLSDGIDATVALEPQSCLRIVPGNLDQALTARWLERTRLKRDRAEIPIASSEVLLRQGTVEGKIWFAGGGEIEVDLEPLSSYGELRSGVLQFEPGSVRELVLSDWIVAPVTRD